MSSRILVLFLLPSMAVSSQCEIKISPNEMETELYRMKCVPEEMTNDVVKASTICIMTCKSNNLRFKHRCNLNGKWDSTPDLEKCGKVVICPNPIQKWKQWSWKCVGLNQGSKCRGSCIKDSSLSTEISCTKEGSWKPKTDLDKCDFVTCPDPSTLWKSWIWTCGEGVNAGSICKGTCSVNGEKRAEMSCGIDGAWTTNDELEKCTLVSCQDPTLLWKHLTWTCDGLNQGETCKGSCKLNSENEIEITCQNDGSWLSDHEMLENSTFCPRRGKVILAGGFYFPVQDTNITDIIDLDDENPKNQVVLDYPLMARQVQAALLNDSGKMVPLFCGGYPYNYDCFTYNNTSHGFQPFTSLIYSNIGSASVVQWYNKEQFLWITGGWDGNYRNRTQQVLLNGSVSKGPEMPLRLASHCAVALSDQTVLIIGGEDGQLDPPMYSVPTNKTYLYSFELNTWTVGPELANARWAHACAVHESDVYVVGGNNDDDLLDSVELAMLDQDDVSSMNWEWTSAPKFPHKMQWQTMVSTKSALYVIGGEFLNQEFSNKIFELNFFGKESSTWMELPQKLTVARRSVAPVIFPDDKEEEVNKLT